MLKGRGLGKVSSDYEKVEKIYFLIGKAYEETGAAYLLISFSYKQTAAAYEEIEKIDFLPLQSKKPLPVKRERLFASDLFQASLRLLKHSFPSLTAPLLSP